MRIFKLIAMLLLISEVVTLGQDTKPHILTFKAPNGLYSVRLYPDDKGVFVNGFSESRLSDKTTHI